VLRTCWMGCSDGIEQLENKKQISIMDNKALHFIEQPLNYYCLDFTIKKQE